QKPPLANHLPLANLVPGSEEYILDAAYLDKNGVTASELGFDTSEEAATADYRVNGNALHLLLVLYPTQQIARKYTDQIIATTPALMQSTKRIGPLLAITSGTTDTPTIKSIL